MRDQILGGRYRLARELGRGGMGQVWAAQDETLGRPVAVKVISLLAEGGGHGGEARARFLREARITAQLQHPNIVTVHDLGETGAEGSKVPFLVMELVRGKGLDAQLGRGVAALSDAAVWGGRRFATRLPRRTMPGSCTGTSSLPISSSRLPAA